MKINIKGKVITTGTALHQTGWILFWGAAPVKTPVAKYAFFKLTTRQIEWRAGRNGKTHYISLIIRPRDTQIMDTQIMDYDTLVSYREGKKLVRIAV